jgi:hypothetical protein
MKTHLRQGTDTYGRSVPACGLHQVVTRKGGVLNSVQVSPQLFKTTEPADRCVKCEAVFLRKRNEQRKGKGLPPVSSFDERPEAV